MCYTFVFRGTVHADVNTQVLTIVKLHTCFWQLHDSGNPSSTDSYGGTLLDVRRTPQSTSDYTVTALK